MKMMHEFRLSKTDKSKSLQLSFDVFNVLNLLSNSWGHVTFVTNLNNYTVNFLQFVKDANGVAPGKPSSGYIPTFNFVKPNRYEIIIIIRWILLIQDGRANWG